MISTPHRRSRSWQAPTSWWRIAAAAFVLVGCSLLSPAAAEEEATRRDMEFYERKIRPLLAEHCYECHAQTAKRVEAELSLDTRAGVLKGGENGPILDAAHPESSLLLQVVGFDGDIQMPPAGKLSRDEIASLNQWVSSGAPMPDDGSVAAQRQSIDFEAGKKFWSFLPLRSVPPSTATGDSNNPIDAYWQACLKERRLIATPPAAARTLIRRVTFDLLGLPPSPEEVEEFVNDKSPQAYDRLLERLLASPHYGERWGRYWLDLARYADGNKTSLEVRGGAWLYRDWVVRAFNEDLPYDEFVRRQLAADHLPGLPPDELAALGFLGISPQYFKELKLSPVIIKSIVADEWEERIDALGRTFLGLSLACARCHDHKFDPIGTDDYYALAGVLASTQLKDRPILAEPQATVVREAVQKVKGLKEKIKKLQDAKPTTTEAKAELAELQKQMQAIERETPRYDSAQAHAIDDAALYVLPDGTQRTKLEHKPGEALDLPIQIRGNPMKPGRVVPRRFLTVLSSGVPQPFKQGSGRGELAQAIVGDAAPLSARVIVNRVWDHHFGRGLVETVSDFGAQGDRPSHPELLDDLALRFIKHGWSLKWLHRQIMTSTAYRQASDFDAAKYAVDPENRRLWRMNRRRLDVEAWRDALLASCGNLDRTLGGPSLETASLENHRRTLYGKIDRSNPDDMLRLFDFPDPANHAPSREPTTTALQQLFVLNGPLMLQQAKTLAKSLTAEPAPDAAAIVRRAYRQLFAREPSANELRLGVGFLTTAGKSPSAETVQQYAQALLGSNEFMFVD